MRGDACPEKRSDRGHCHGDLPYHGPAARELRTHSSAGEAIRCQPPGTSGTAEAAIVAGPASKATRSPSASELEPRLSESSFMFSISTRSQILTQILVDTGERRHHRRCSTPEADGMEAKAQPRTGWSRVSLQRALRAEPRAFTMTSGSGRWPPSTTSECAQHQRTGTFERGSLQDRNYILMKKHAHSVG